MNKVFLLSVAFCASTVLSVFAESSEDNYTLVTACQTSFWIHAGQVLWLDKESRFRDIVMDDRYSIGTFQHMKDTDWGDALFFVVNNNGIIWEQKYAELYLVNCSPESGQTVHFPVHRIEPNTQYSPEVLKVAKNYIFLDDWQNTDGKSVHVSNIFDRTNSIFYPIRDTLVKKEKRIMKFVGNKPFYWTVLSYNKGIVTIEVRLSSAKKSNFAITLR